ncbi:TraB/GumN family protein [Synechococcus sp. BA-132 BA5]|uniref:TraB/GumN family protein n=1 Tax=Synechococcus sp. BA-132 BA5 TaxID=3110252 RepID=UPI002B2186DF|nr:TraB/GumN family protein [Synechococcus sp. BA-132 BA5]MEA5416374.1 TraB/GumN family protein [Synechococcus sp. BA-132 BA5]
MDVVDAAAHACAGAAPLLRPGLWRSGAAGDGARHGRPQPGGPGRRADGRAIDPQGRSLRDGLPAASWRALEPRLAGLGLPEAAIDRFEPWAVALLLASAEFLQRGYSPDSGVEGQLQARAAADRKPIDGLETPAQQLELFDGLPRADQLELLELTLGERDSVGPRLEALERPDLHQRLVIRRNAAWVAPVKELLRRPDDTLVVVGLMHLLGEQGLIALLRTQGLQLERFVAGAWRLEP